MPPTWTATATWTCSARRETGDTIAWWENTAGDGSAWTQHIVSSTFDGAASVYAADVDGDGDLDVLGAACDWPAPSPGGRTRPATAAPGPQHIVSSSFVGAISVYAADVDGDGDMDVLGAAYDADTIAWWENTAGDGSAWTEHIVSSTFDGAYSVYAADVDGDGDLDVLGAAYGADTIAWWENTAGDGSAWTQHIVSSTLRRRRRRSMPPTWTATATWTCSARRMVPTPSPGGENETIHRSAAYPPAGMHTLEQRL